MEDSTPIRASAHRQRFTFHGNPRDTRAGWLRLTPAYSRNLVRELVQARAELGAVLDPFSGTGTTVLTCTELGVACDAVELNPFLVWLARCKVADYSKPSIASARRALAVMTRKARDPKLGLAWIPPLSNIEKWWDTDSLEALSRAFSVLERLPARLEPGARDILRLAFCRTLIATANVSFGHQSMSFKRGRVAPATRSERAGRAENVALVLEQAFESMARAALLPLSNSRRRVLLGDSRDIGAAVGRKRYATVITSPPYANRMSYIRELRPYMYWLGHLRDAPSAGQLDWRAIGGTWGSATSNLQTWKPEGKSIVPYSPLQRLVQGIAEQSPILARYVEKYFYDMAIHAASLARVVASGGRINYIVGNSKFFDVLLPVQEILARLFEAHGFREVDITTLRKRTSKAELFEYLVRGTKRADRATGSR